jgi:hypothetical protein
MDKCPYCKAELKKTPQRKTKCKACGKFIYAKRSPSEETKRLVTEEDALKIDREWKDYHLENERKRILSNYNKEQSDYENVFNHLKAKTGREPSLNEIEIEFLNELISLTTDPNKLANWYGRIAWNLYQEDQDCREFQKKQFLYQLKNIMKAGIKEVEVIGPIDDITCWYCKAINNKIFKVEEIADNLPIPGSCECYIYNEEFPYCRSVLVGNFN